MRHAGLPEVSANCDVLDRVKVFARPVMVEAVKAYPSLVWIMREAGRILTAVTDNLVREQMLAAHHLELPDPAPSSARLT